MFLDFRSLWEAQGVTFFQSLTGTLTTTGGLTKRVAKSLDGTLTFIGTLTKRANKALVGVLTSSGVLTSARAFLLTLTGTLTLSGSLTKRAAMNALGGTLTFTGKFATWYKLRFQWLPAFWERHDNEPMKQSSTPTVSGPEDPVGTTRRLTVLQRLELQADVGARGGAAGQQMQRLNSNTLVLARNDAKVSVVDITNPAIMVERSIVQPTIPDAATSLHFRGALAYMTFAHVNGFRIVDFTNPLAPTTLGGALIAFTDVATDCGVQGQYAYVLNAGGLTNFTVLDVSNPALPTVAGTLTLPGDPTSIWVEERYAYIGLENGAPNSFQVVDISNPGSPVIVGTGPGFESEPRVLVKYRNTVFAGTWFSHFVSWDVTDPTNPRQIAHPEMPLGSDNDPRRWNTTALSYPYVAVGGPGLVPDMRGDGDVVRIMDVSDPTNPKVTHESIMLLNPPSGTNPRNGVGSMVYTGDYLFLGLHSHHLVSLSVKDPIHNPNK